MMMPFSKSLIFLSIFLSPSDLQFRFFFCFSGKGTFADAPFSACSLEKNSVWMPLNCVGNHGGVYCGESNKCNPPPVFMVTQACLWGVRGDEARCCCHGTHRIRGIEA